MTYIWLCEWSTFSQLFLNNNPWLLIFRFKLVREFLVIRSFLISDLSKICFVVKALAKSWKMSLIELAKNSTSFLNSWENRFWSGFFNREFFSNIPRFQNEIKYHCFWNSFRRAWFIRSRARLSMYSKRRKLPRLALLYLHCRLWNRSL